MEMPSGPVRRGQLIAPFGVGAMIVVPNGASLIAAGLDKWYRREDGEDSQNLDLDEYYLEEWRLQDLLKVSHFRLPPDFRRSRFGQDVPNLFLTVPYLRFPQWHFCWRCNLLTKRPLSLRGRDRCEDCQKKGKYSQLAQVPFIAMCDYGHIQDFPWREWVHHDADPACSGQLRLKSTGGATLSAQKVECDGCGVEPRSLSRITEAEPDGSETFLSSRLAKDKVPFLCSGFTPWRGDEQPHGCGRPLRGSLRSASNVYFALTKSSIYLPRATGDFPEELAEVLTTPAVSAVISILQQAGQEVTPEILRTTQRDLLQPYSDDQVSKALVALMGDRPPPPTEEDVDAADIEESDEVDFRYEEYQVLRVPQASRQLTIRTAKLSDYSPSFADCFERVMLLDNLRETRALVGFNRVFADSPAPLKDRRGLLWSEAPAWKDSWLPAYVVHGEGIFLELNHKLLSDWETRPEVLKRLAPLIDRYENARSGRHLRPRSISPRFVLLHTFAHLLMNQLTFECGYSSAALRERLYVSTRGERVMAGLLIYTAAGDAEGTMGGLVRMGKSGNLERTFFEALQGARWCSADPVCMEIGARGQGPDSCNLAACHNCGLVPETACEEFNRFLDRGLVVGSLEDPDLGFFSSVLDATAQPV